MQFESDRIELSRILSRYDKTAREGFFGCRQDDGWEWMVSLRHTGKENGLG